MRRSRRLRLALAVVAAAAIGATVVGISSATFTSTTSNPTSSFGAKRIFPRIRSTSAWTIRDASGGGAETNSDDALSYATDLRTTTTGNWANAFNTSRYLEFDFSGSTPSGVSVSSAQFNFNWASNAATETSCVYIAVYRASTSTLLNTYGSSGSPLACANTLTPNQTINQSISDVVTTTTTLNDLRVRVYAYESNAKGIKVDRATVTGSTAYGNFTLYEKIYRDASTGTATTTNWGVATSGDSGAYTNVSNWATSFAAGRYLKFTFDPGVATGSVITTATVDFRYKAATNGDTICWYFETYNGLTLLGTHGSSGTPVSCNATTSYSTDNVSLSELTSVADANALTVKAYVKDSTGTRKMSLDLVQLNVTYYLN
jgi:hypothetical protein